MKIKRYIANDSQEAMIKIRSELGTEAVILHSRKIKKQGIVGYFQKPLVEVVAAIDEKDNQENKSIRKIESESIGHIANGSDNETMTNQKIDALQGQLNSLESLLLNIANKSEVDQEGSKDIPVYDKYLKFLVKNEVEENIARKILNIAQKQIKFTIENEETIKKAIKVIIKEYLGQPSPINDAGEHPRTIIFVGPTGVGKTTTLAKLAAKLSIRDGKSVGLITSDTYRIAAVEQLRTYSEILNIPLKVIYDPEDIKEAVENLDNKDIILIDTAGRNHRVEEQLYETKTLIKNITNPEIYLVISATTAVKDIKSIIQSYNFIDDFKLIFTKVDEASTAGNILNTKVLTGKDLSYYTNGQIVPDDIEVANSEKIVDLIVGE